MTYRAPALLDAAHILSRFDCGQDALNDFLVRRALANQLSGASRTWVVTDGTPVVVAFYASATASILRGRLSTKAARNQPDEVPAIVLGRMAVDEKHQHQGLGAAMLKHFLQKAIEVSELVGVRLVLVHAKDEPARNFYLHHDFEPSPIDELTLVLLLADLSA